MKKIRALIVDDERLARMELNLMLQQFDTVEVVGEADNVDAAAECIAQTQPTLIFLDIQMPGKTGFELLPLLENHIDIVFVTAYDQYAIRAFEVNSLDYLLKPVSIERLSISIDRSRLEAQKKQAIQQTTIPVLLQTNDQIWVTIGKQREFIRLSSVRYIRSADPYSEVITGADKTYLSSQSLLVWAEQLPESFVRISRSEIINLARVQSVMVNKNGTREIQLEGVSEKLIMSRRIGAQKRELFKRWFIKPSER